ncbi:MAG TPA: hypothetical protein VFR78_21000, partial [Pyrinomonadaceae bacterium]|nr:hypothetical protein [Pyrinomonadaceae bacterium]
CQRRFKPPKRIHRLSLDAQQFVYEKWCAVMKREGIDLSQAFGYDPAVLRAAQHKSWFKRNTEPDPDDPYPPVTDVEALMRRLLYE